MLFIAVAPFKKFWYCLSNCVLKSDHNHPKPQDGVHLLGNLFLFPDSVVSLFVFSAASLNDAIVFGVFVLAMRCNRMVKQKCNLRSAWVTPCSCGAIEIPFGGMQLYFGQH